MSRPHAAWWGLLAILGVLDVLADRRHNHSTLSCAIRHTLRTDTRQGRAILVGSLAAANAWLIPHLLSHELDDLLEDIDLTNLTN